MQDHNSLLVNAAHEATDIQKVETNFYQLNADYNLHIPSSGWL